MQTVTDVPEIEDLLHERPDPSQGDGATGVWGIVWEAEATPRPILYEEVAGWAVTEGDLRLGRTSEAIEYRPAEGTPALVFGATLTAGALIPAQRTLWPGRIPFDCDGALSAKVERAKERWNQAVGHFLPLVEKTPADADYIHFVVSSLSDGNLSDVGKKENRQDVMIVLKSAVFKLVHEIGHVAGLYHEHNRSDRDDYIEIQWHNIETGKDKHFHPYLSNGKDHGAYDFDSIMHYPPVNDFGIGGEPTFQVTPGGLSEYGGQPQFQQTTLSPGDVAALEELYGA